jgi:hypothetical protein
MKCYICTARACTSLLRFVAFTAYRKLFRKELTGFTQVCAYFLYINVTFSYVV